MWSQIEFVKQSWRDEIGQYTSLAREGFAASYRGGRAFALSSPTKDPPDGPVSVQNDTVLSCMLRHAPNDREKTDPIELKLGRNSVAASEGLGGNAFAPSTV